ncbi:SDR family NAD(P)-dependent oxidoreductase [Texcoconibacillus texcoconensis]|uniref:Oxidoreductase n=1 Tax=Texcoconibacillus texcoconensis TaxID=1095777 RepID=A0A840QNP0_9BACI|nr:SDR family oxidoreductase [Texcoconibacillus texcoconensis]MBB5173006.1 hypothetical protein [Texcoconibacillus texcoconensis]
MDQRTVSGKRVAITGASSGIGKEIAYDVARRGGIPILLARSLDVLEQEADMIESATNIRPFVYRLDVSDEQAVQTTFEEIGNIDVLINNAGYGRFAPFVETELSEVRNLFDVNVFGLIACTKAVLPSMLHKRCGQVIFVASLASKVSTPKASAYSASKHAVRAIADSLRLELAHTGVKVSTVNPGPVRTNFFERADESGSYKEQVDRIMLNADIVARKTVDLIERPRRELDLPRWMGIAAKGYQLFPSLVDTLFGDQLRKK